MSKIICIDPGHGGIDAGAVNGKRYEKTDTLKMALAVAKILKSYNQAVCLIRDTDRSVDLNSRPLIANRLKADYFLSIHRNSFTKPTARGAEIWIYSKADQSTAKKAQTILNKVCGVDKKIVNRGVKRGYTGNSSFDYCVNRYSNMPSALLELLYISTPSDNTLFDRNFNALAKAVADGIMEALGESCRGQTQGEAKEDNMSFKLNDKNDGVYALKRELITAQRLGVIKQKVNDDSIFGTGTQSAVKEVQRLAGLAQSGVADTATIKALGVMVDKESDNLKSKLTAVKKAVM